MEDPQSEINQEEKNEFVKIIQDKANDKSYGKSCTIFNKSLKDITTPRPMNSYQIPMHLKNLEAQIEAFQKNKFPVLCLPKLKRKKRKKTVSTIPKIIESPPRKINIPSSLRPSPIPEFKLPKMSNRYIGPGSYYSEIKELVPGSYIPKQPRFLSSFEEKVNYFMNKKTPSEDIDFSQIIEKRNKDLEKFSPDAKERYSKEKVKEHDFRLKIQKKTKEILEGHDKKTKEEKYSEKISKYE